MPDRDPRIRDIQAEAGVPVELPTSVKEPCAECPWRREALAGWLGPQTAREWIEMVHGEAPIMCHRTCNPEASYDGTRQCRGAAIFRANVCKSPRREDVAVGPEDKEQVFASSQEFLNHHERKETT